MSEWVRLDITSFTKTTNREKVLKILKGAKVSEQLNPIFAQKERFCTDMLRERMSCVSVYFLKDVFPEQKLCLI